MARLRFCEVEGPSRRFDFTRFASYALRERA